MNPMALSENLVEHAPQGEFCTELINCIAEINLKPVDVCSSFLSIFEKRLEEKGITVETF